MLRLLFSALALVLLAGPATAVPPPKSAQDLFSALATMKGLEAQFSETRTLALLKAPLKSTGTLYYRAPGYLTRVTATPSPSTVRIGPQGIQIAEAGQKRHIDLSSRPEIRLFVASFVKILAGELSTLSSTYDVTFQSAEGGRWSVVLRPRSPTLSKLITRLVLAGSGFAVETLLVEEASGDRTETRILNPNPKRVYSPSERARLFGSPAEP